MDVVLPDKLRLLSGTSELVSLDADRDQRGNVVGGLLVCRDRSGGVGVALSGGIEGASGGSLYVRSGFLRITGRDGKDHVLVVSADDLEKEDGGILALSAAGDAAQGPVGGRGAIVLNAAKRSLIIRSKGGEARVELGTNGNLYLGGGGTQGDLILRGPKGSERIKLGVAQHRLLILADDGSPIVELGEHGNLALGGGGYDADLLLRNKKGETRIHLDTGGGGDPNPTARVFVDGVKGNLSLGSNDTNGNLYLRDTKGNVRIELDADGGHVRVKKASGDVMIHIDGDKGDIILPNGGDCAEDFDLAGSEVCDPGTVMSLDAQGRLCASRQAYDKKVAGVLSGAGDLRPGLVLGRKPADNVCRQPLALVGKVFVKVDAGFSPIEVGDLLTTSPTPGHAMRACDPLKAFGAVIGKALRPLTAGQGLIPILVSLQ